MKSKFMAASAVSAVFALTDSVAATNVFLTFDEYVKRNHLSVAELDESGVANRLRGCRLFFDGDRIISEYYGGFERFREYKPINKLYRAMVDATLLEAGITGFKSTQNVGYNQLVDFAKSLGMVPLLVAINRIPKQNVAPNQINSILVELIRQITRDVFVELEKKNLNPKTPNYSLTDLSVLMEQIAKGLLPPTLPLELERYLDKDRIVVGTNAALEKEVAGLGSMLGSYEQIRTRIWINWIYSGNDNIKGEIRGRFGATLRMIDKDSATGGFWGMLIKTYNNLCKVEKNELEMRSVIDRLCIDHPDDVAHIKRRIIENFPLNNDNAQNVSVWNDLSSLSISEAINRVPGSLRGITIEDGLPLVVDAFFAPYISEMVKNLSESK